MRTPRGVEHSYGAEVARKCVHLSSLSIPLIYAFISKETALAVLVPLTLAFLAADLARFRVPALGEWYHGWFGWMLRPHERDGGIRRLNGATWVLLSATLCVLVFPKLIFLTAFSILIVSDTSAALAGRKFGRHPFLRKTLEGAAAFFLSALAVVALSPKILHLPLEYLIGGIGALVGTVVESVSIGVDDNLSIPVTIGAMLWLLYALMMPGADVFLLDSIR
ncbi:MAG: dolichol kinase [Bacteroidota bacterium]